MKWFSKEGERYTWLEVLVLYPLAFLAFLTMVFFLLLMPE